MKKFIYLISPNKIDKNFYNSLKKVLSSNKVQYFQLRLKNQKKKKIIQISKKIKKITKFYNVKFIINDNHDLLKKIGADGCHLGQSDGNISMIKKRIKNKVLGITCHNSKKLAKKAKAMGASLFADKITADQADRWGLIWEAVPDDSFEQVWLSRASHLANGPTVAYGYLKDALKSSFDNDLDSQLSLEAKLQNHCGNTRDFQEGVLAFLQKRDAKFEGR